MRERGIFASVVFAAAACTSPGPSQASQTIEATRSPEHTLVLKTGIAIGHPLTDDLYVINGPHNKGKDKDNPNAVKSAIDARSSQQIPCNTGDKKTITDVKVVAPITGTVTTAGETKEVHSIVEIDDEKGHSVQLVHLDNIQVQKGQRVQEGKTIIGEMSCERPPEGETDEIHLHIGVKENGQPVPIFGSALDDFQIKEDGTMKNKDPYVILNYTVTPDPRNCGPSKESIAACDGRINYIPHPKNAKPGIVKP